MSISESHVPPWKQPARVANASMITTYDRTRVVRRAGRVSAEALRALDRALAVHLGLRAESLQD